MDSVKLAILTGILVICIDQCTSSEICNGIFYSTYIDSYYGRYHITSAYHSGKYCADKCCTITRYYYYYHYYHVSYYYYYNSYYFYYGRYYKYCCTDYESIPSYKPSSRPLSTTGLIVGCTFGGVLFAIVVIFSLFVLRCMWNDKKRINPIAKEMDLDSATETTVAMENVLAKETNHQSPKYDEEDTV